MYRVLYQKAVELLELSGKETVLDAYCGIGTIGMYISRFVKQVIGVEINRDAVEDAKINAKINQISNIRFVCEDAGRYMTRLAAEKKRLDVVIMDPPRSGSSEEFIKSLVRMKPKQVLYISCNPQTQIRDLQMVKEECGLEKQFSYKEAGMEAGRRPNCPPEKREAIIDAFVHFGMMGK